jgi:hypothetical protein
MKLQTSLKVSPRRFECPAAHSTHLKKLHETGESLEENRRVVLGWQRLALTSKNAAQPLNQNPYEERLNIAGKGIIDRTQTLSFHRPHRGRGIEGEGAAIVFPKCQTRAQSESARLISGHSFY